MDNWGFLSFKSAVFVTFSINQSWPLNIGRSQVSSILEQSEYLSPALSAAVRHSMKTPMAARALVDSDFFSFSKYLMRSPSVGSIFITLLSWLLRSTLSTADLIIRIHGVRFDPIFSFSDPENIYTTMSYGPFWLDAKEGVRHLSSPLHRSSPYQGFENRANHCILSGLAPFLTISLTKRTGLTSASSCPHICYQMVLQT